MSTDGNIKILHSSGTGDCSRQFHLPRSKVDREHMLSQEVETE